MRPNPTGCVATLQNAVAKPMQATMKDPPDVDTCQHAGAESKHHKLFLDPTDPSAFALRHHASKYAPRYGLLVLQDYSNPQNEE
eukprot:1199421-Amphidinium_carterae.2